MRFSWLFERQQQAVRPIATAGISMFRQVRKAIKILAALALFAVLGFTLFLGLLWIDHTRETTLPTPTGPFAVGRASDLWSDSAHDDPMAPKPGTKRQLLAWIWYPAAPALPSQTRADYLPATWRTAFYRQAGPLLSHFITRDLSQVHAHSLHEPQLSLQQPSYPVVFMRGGAASLTTQYTSLAEDLASHGYVVVGFDAPYRSMTAVFPDGRVIARAPQNNIELAAGAQQLQLATRLAQTWSADISFALHQLQTLNASDPTGRFHGRLDLKKIGIFGHSLGGATALEFCHDDPRCTAGIDVDGLPVGSVIREGLTRPFMFLMSDHSGEKDADSGQVLANIHSIYDRLPADRRLYIMIEGADHYRFSDNGAMLQVPLVIAALHSLGIVRLDGRRQIAITAHYVSTFFDVYLKGAPASELKSRAEYPEAQYVR